MAKQSSLYKLWANLKYKINNPKSRDYPRYGGAGVFMDKNWSRNYIWFASYIENNLGKRPPKHSLQMIDPELGFTPGNVVWKPQYSLPQVMNNLLPKTNTTKSEVMNTPKCLKVKSWKELLEVYRSSPNI